MFLIKEEKTRDLPKSKAGWKVSLSTSAPCPPPAAAVHTSVSTARACGTVQKDVWEEIKVKNTKLFGYVLSPD